MPNADILFKIANKLDVSPAWLAFGTETIDQLSDRAIQIAAAYDAVEDDDTRRLVDKLLHINHKQKP